MKGEQNLADCASRGLYPKELIDHKLWWHGPSWLRLSPSEWLSQTDVPPNPSSNERKEISLHAHLGARELIFPIDRFSSYNMLKHVTGWVMRFVGNLKKILSETPPLKSPLTLQENVEAETYWITVAQGQCFSSELKCLNSKVSLPSNSSLFSLHPLEEY